MHPLRHAAPALLLSVLLSGCDHATPSSIAAPEQPLLATTNVTASPGNPGLVYPVTGMSSDGKRFQGTMTITGARLSPQIGPVLNAVLRGNLAGASNDDVLPMDEIAFTFAEIEHVYKPQQRNCTELRVNFGTVQLPAEKIGIQFQIVRVDTKTLPGPGDLLRNLLCMSRGLAPNNSL